MKTHIEVKSWRHHEKTRLHQSNLWNNNRKRRPSPPRFKFINVVKSSTLPNSAAPTTNGNANGGDSMTPNNMTTIENSGTANSGGSMTPPNQSPPNQTNASSLLNASSGISNNQSNTPQNGSTSMIISQSSSSSSSNLSSNYALGNSNGYYSSKSDMLNGSTENIGEGE